MRSPAPLKAGVGYQAKDFATAQVNPVGVFYWSLDAVAEYTNP